MSLTYLDTQLDELRAEAKQLNDRFARTRAEIERDPNLSAEGKKIEIDQWRESTKASLNGLRDRELKLVDDKIGELERQLDAKVGHTSSDLIAFRDAQDRAEKLNNPEDAERVLARAIRTDDKSLAHAVFRRALDSRWGTVIKQFEQANPQLATVANDLNTLEQFRAPSIQRAMIYGLLS